MAGSALLVLAALSCSQELGIDPQDSQEYVFKAIWADGTGTRTALQEDGTSVWWTTGEEINVFYGSIASAKFVSTNTEAVALTSFSGSLPVVTGTVEDGHSASAFWGVYPYDAANTCDGESVTLTIPETQPATEGSFADKFFPAVAVSQDFALAFYNVCGGARFSVANEGIDAVTFRAVGGESLVGKVKVGFADDGKPVVQQVSEASAEVTVNAPAGGFVPGKYYFAAFLPGTLSQGLKVTYCAATRSASITLPGSLTVNRSRFGTIDCKDEGLTFVDGGGSGHETIVLDKSRVVLSLYGTAILRAELSDPDLLGNDMEWNSSDEKVVTVTKCRIDNNGVFIGGSSCVVSAIGEGSAIVSVTNAENGYVAACEVEVRSLAIPETVDMGLSVGWASFNVGASSPTEFGGFYAWGETVPKQDYDWNHYKWCNGSPYSITKYCTKANYGYNGFTDMKSCLEREDDAASVQLGCHWRTPTDVEWMELIEGSTWSWASMEGMQGMLVTSVKTGNSLFLPACGNLGTIDYDNGPIEPELILSGGSGNYFSSSLYEDQSYRAWEVIFNSTSVYMNKGFRWLGRPIRAVFDEE